MLRNESNKVDQYNKKINKDKAEYFKIVFDNLTRIAKIHDFKYLTAPQIEVPFKIIAYKHSIMENSKNSNEYGIMINPEIIAVSKKKYLVSQKCVSMNIFESQIVRPESAIIKFRDSENNTLFIKISGEDCFEIVKNIDLLHGISILNINRNFGNIVLNQEFDFPSVEDCIQFYQNRIADYIYNCNLEINDDNNNEQYKYLQEIFKEEKEKKHKIKLIDKYKQYMVLSYENYKKCKIPNEQIILTNYNKQEYVNYEEYYQSDYLVKFPFEFNMLVDIEKCLRKEMKKLL